MMVSSIGKFMVAVALAGVLTAPACSGQTMRDRMKQRMAERRATGTVLAHSHPMSVSVAVEHERLSVVGCRSLGWRAR